MWLFRLFNFSKNTMFISDYSKHQRFIENNIRKSILEINKLHVMLEQSNYVYHMEFSWFDNITYYPHIVLETDTNNIFLLCDLKNQLTYLKNRFENNCKTIIKEKDITIRQYDIICELRFEFNLKYNQFLEDFDKLM